MHKRHAARTFPHLVGSKEVVGGLLSAGGCPWWPWNLTEWSGIYRNRKKRRRILCRYSYESDECNAVPSERYKLNLQSVVCATSSTMRSGSSSKKWKSSRSDVNIGRLRCLLTVLMKKIDYRSNCGTQKKHFVPPLGEMSFGCVQGHGFPTTVGGWYGQNDTRIVPKIVACLIPTHITLSKILK